MFTATPLKASTKPLLDRAIDAVFPAWGARRQMWRDFQNSYSGGISTRLAEPWYRSISYAAGTQGDRQQLGFARDRARNVDRKNPIGRGLLNREVDNVVGEGFTLQARTASPEFNVEAEQKFAEWMEIADVRGLKSGGEFQRLAYRTGRRDGDAGIVLVDQGGQSKLQLIPGDLIVNPDGRMNTPALADGVELGPAGRPTAYHVADFDEFGKRKWTRVPANQFVFLSHVTEPLQIRGETCYMQIFDLLSHLDRYVDGVSLAAWMATVFGLIFKDNNSGKAMAGLPSLLNSHSQAQKAITFENGAIKFVGPEGSVVQVDARQPMQQTPDFIRMMLRLIGIPFDMPLELVLLDVSQANLSSLRGGMQQYYRACKNRQQNFRRAMSMIYRWFVSREVKAGNFISKVPDLFWPHHFQPRGWEFADPVKEVQAAMLEVDAGINSTDNICAALGRDADHIQKQQKAYRDRAARLGQPDIRSIMTRDPLSSPAPAATKPDPDADEQDQEVDPELEDTDV